MLQLESSTMNKTFTRITREPAPTHDFISKNRKAVRNIGKSKRITPHPPTIKPVPPYKQRPPPSATVTTIHNNTSSGDALDATVVISRSYLEHLLRTSLDGPIKEPVPAEHHHTQLQTVEGTLPQVTQLAEATTGPQARRKLARQQESPVDYFPFGRPGCGAPLRTESGQVMADLRQRTRIQDQGHATISKKTQQPPSVVQPAPSQSATVEGGKLSQSIEMASPRYARGAGPHVNQYVLKDKEEKRKKELEHVEYLKAQIAAKERAKRVEKEKAEREEREAQAKFLRDRQKMLEEQEREAEKAKRKEEEARQRQALIQQAIDKAAEAAERERQRAKSFQHRHSHPRGSKYESPTHTVDPRQAGKVYDSSNSVSADLHSPSMLKLNTKEDIQSSRGMQQTIRKGQGSRIPVRSKGGAGKSRPHGTPSSRPKQIQTSSSNSRTMGKHANISSKKTEETAAWTTPMKTTSPPVPTLAKRLQHDEMPQHQHHKAMPMPASRVQSPPVPALAKKLKYAATAGENRANLPQPARDTPPPLHLPPVQGGTQQVVTRSPPAGPALRKGTEREATHLPPLVPPGVGEAHPPQAVLKQLLELRRGLLSHRSTLDRKLDTLFR